MLGARLTSLEGPQLFVHLPPRKQAPDALTCTQLLGLLHRFYVEPSLPLERGLPPLGRGSGVQGVEQGPRDPHFWLLFSATRGHKHHRP